MIKLSNYKGTQYNTVCEFHSRAGSIVIDSVLEFDSTVPPAHEIANALVNNVSINTLNISSASVIVIEGRSDNERNLVLNLFNLTEKGMYKINLVYLNILQHQQIPYL